MLREGTRLGPYEITGSLGAGGMGEVYRARDTKLNRDVAIKILPELFATDPDRLARFEREARTLAAVNHPHIAQVFGVEESGQIHALVMELVDGEDLTQRIARGRMSAVEAWPIVRQIAEGLDAAHEQGIVHRDLKPANIRLRPDGVVKILDFGLARMMPSASGVDKTSTVITELGLVMGTPAYMSPEQARGLPTDARTDIWALGCVAFELRTGRRPFAGDTSSDAIVSVLEREPDWTATNLSSFERALLRRCLQKDPRRRWHDAGDLGFAIEDGLSIGSGAVDGRPGPPPARKHGLRTLLPLAIAAAIAGVAIDRARVRRPSAPAPVISRIAVPLSENDRLEVQRCPTFALSPDGTQLAFIATRNGRRGIFIRSANELEPRLVAGGEDAVDTVLFSPDGAWIAFFADQQLRKVPAAGGAPSVLATTRVCGGDWPTSDRIVWGNRDGVFEVAASGGEPRRLVAADRQKGELGLLAPHLLPGGKTILFTLASANETRLVAQRLETGERKVLVERGDNAVYTTGGTLLYSDAGAIFAVPFDPDALTIGGAPSRVVDGLLQLEGGVTPLSVARSSPAVAYVPGGAQPSTAQSVVWLDRQGGAQPIAVPPGRYSSPRLSPDGRRLALTKSDGLKNDIWVYDFERTTLTPLTADHDNRTPVWTPDGAHIIYASDQPGVTNLYRRRADGAGAEERLTTSDRVQIAGACSADGRWLVFVQHNAAFRSEIWTLPLQGADRTPRPFLSTRFNAASPGLSPDGRWISYVSDETRRAEVYVQPFPGGGARIQISTEGGRHPVWSRSGRELFYRNGSKIMMVEVTNGPTLTAKRPRVLFDDTAGTQDLDLSRDGQQFLVLTRPRPPAPVTRLNVLLDWRKP